MRRILLSAVILLAAAAFVVIAGGASNAHGGAGTYKIEFNNAFGLVTGEDMKVAGVPAGKISSIDLCGYVQHSDCQNRLDALITVNVTQGGFGSFRTDAFCQSRPESLIGEYFIDCNPGQYGKPLKSGSTIPVSRTESTISSDLIQNILRLPYRERLTLIINELGAAVAARSEDLQTALQRAVPALTETDNLLDLLANDSHTIQQLNVNANQVITALANNSGQVQRFIDEADNLTTDTAAQQGNFQQTWAKLPGFLEQLRPAMAKLGAAAVAQEPVLANLNAATGHLGAVTTGPDQLKNFFVNLVSFANGSQPALQSLGQASAVGTPAVKAATPTVSDLNQFAKPTPELAQNLAIVLHDIDDRNRAVEPDKRSPDGGRGYTGLEALLQYAFNQAVAINTFGPYGHMLAVDGFYSQACSPYANTQTQAQDFANYANGSLAQNPRSCYSWLGPSQPGVNEPDPSNPGACVPDPGGAPPGEPGPNKGACKLTSSGAPAADTGGGGSQGSAASASTNKSADTSATPSGSSGSSASSSAANAPPSAASGGSPGAASTGSASGSGGSGGGSSGGQTQQLLNYLLAP